VNTYADELAAAREGILDAGREVSTIALRSNATVDQPWKTGKSEQTITTQAAVFVPAAGTGLGTDWIRDDLLARVSEVCLLAWYADLDDVTTLVDGGKKYAVEWVQALKPGGQTLLYAMGVKR